MCRIVVTFGRSVFADEAEKIEDALMRALHGLHDANLGIIVYNEITGNTTTTASYAERVTEDDIIMYDIMIDILDGERGYTEHMYYLGTIDGARRYANSYLETIWGEGDETVYIDGDDEYWNKSMEVLARPGGITPFKLTAMTAKGTLPFEASWKVA